jgi:tetratricopeptide (TPR) repeat protein
VRAFHAYNWHPLTWVSLQLDCQLYGLEPWGYHLTNVLLHAASGVVLFLVLRRMTGAVGRSAFVAALFAVHPLNVESVAWVAERKNVLSTFFWMLTLAAYVRYAERPGVGRYLLLALVFALGLTAKAMLVTLPCVLLLLDYWPLRRLRLAGGAPGAVTAAGRALGPVPLRLLLLEKVPLLLLSAGCCVLTVKAQTGVVMSLETFPLGVRLRNALVAYAEYLGRMFWPADLAIFYPHPGSALSAGRLALAGGLLLAITALALAQARRRPYLLVGWLWYLGTLVPVIGLVQVGLQAVADRYTYVPLVGVFIALTWGAADLLARWRVPTVALVPLAGAVLAALWVRTYDQVPSWRDSVTVWGHAVAVTPPNPVARHSLGVGYLQRGDFEEAIAQCDEALRIDPRRPFPHLTLGLTLMRQGKDEEARQHCVRALEALPTFADAHQVLGELLWRRGNVEEAARHFADAVRYKPDFARAHSWLGLALERAGKTAQAKDHYARALEINPDLAEAHCGLGKLLLQEGETAEAMDHFAAALRVETDHAEAHNRLGVAYWRQGQRDQAEHHLGEAVRLNPTAAEARANLGTFLTDEGRTEEALPHLIEAVRLKPKSAEVQHLLGRAYLRQGKLEEAVRRLGEATVLRPDFAEAHNDLGVALLRQGKPAEAAGHFRRAVGLRPKEVAYRCNLALALQDQGQTEAADAEYGTALRFDPRWPRVNNRAAWVLATHPDARRRDGASAVQLARQVCHVTEYRSAECLDALAAAYAEVGDYDKATTWARKALEAANAGGPGPGMGPLQERLLLYRNRQPFRDARLRNQP